MKPMLAMDVDDTFASESFDLIDPNPDPCRSRTWEDDKYVDICTCTSSLSQSAMATQDPLI